MSVVGVVGLVVAVSTAAATVVAAAMACERIRTRYERTDGARCAVRRGRAACELSD